MRLRRTWLPPVGAALLGLFSISPAVGSAAVQSESPSSTATPIKHLVVIFQENVSFDHYFGTYPIAANTSGQIFEAEIQSRVNNLVNTKGAGGVGTLLTNNPNKDAAGNQVNPRRYDPANINDVLTCDQDHNYNDEQKAFNGGAMDKFVTSVGTDGSSKSPTGQACLAKDVMNYYDGNTVTALWNYAQHFAMSDNSYSSTFGPSTPGALNLVSGNTGPVDKMFKNPSGEIVANGKGGFTVIGDPQPYYDDCSVRDRLSLTGLNLGDLLNAQGLSWGWFQGGLRPSTTFAAAATAVGNSGQPTSTFTPDEFNGKFNTPPQSNQGICNTTHPIGVAVGGIGQWGWKDDYIPHHEPFMYYASTANPHHLAPASVAAIGTDTQAFVGGVPQFNTANHQYDMSDFDALVSAISRGYLSPDHLPAVSFLKAPGWQDGHAFYSDPIDEQQFVVNEINALQHTPDWSSTAVVIAYDDSDGWYDHAFSGVHNPSQSPQDFLNGVGVCGPANATPLAGQNGRCGYGPRQPFMVISPFAKHGKVDHAITDLSSVVRFTEDNWHLPRIAGSFDSIAGSLNGMFAFGEEGGHNSKLYLDPVTGQPFQSSD